MQKESAILNQRNNVNRPISNQNIFFQPKLTINQPNDIYEQEADAMTDKVMRMVTSPQKLFFPPATVQRKCDQCEEEKKLKRKESNDQITEAPSSTENYLNSLSGGSSLSDRDKNFFEQGIGYDFSKVRLHTDTAADQSAKNVNALAYTSGNNIVFRTGQYQPETSEGKKLLAHELTHVVQQSGSVTRKIQTKRELDPVTEKDLITKCQARIGEVITKLEGNVKKTGMPDDIKEAVTLLRKKYTDNKIKCYYLDGKSGGETNFSTGEIYMDAKVLEGTTDVFANIGEGNVLHEGTHALHNQKYPVSTKKYGKELENKQAGKTSTLSDAEQKDLQRLDAWTEYWAYRKMQEYNNVKNNTGKSDETIHADTIKDMRSRGAILPLNVVWAFDPDFDPRKWKPKN